MYELFVSRYGSREHKSWFCCVLLVTTHFFCDSILWLMRICLCIYVFVVLMVFYSSCLSLHAEGDSRGEEWTGAREQPALPSLDLPTVCPTSVSHWELFLHFMLFIIAADVITSVIRRMCYKCVGSNIPPGTCSTMHYIY